MDVTNYSAALDLHHVVACSLAQRRSVVDSQKTHPTNEIAMLNKARTHTENYGVFRTVCATLRICRLMCHMNVWLNGRFAVEKKTICMRPHHPPRCSLCLRIFTHAEAVIFEGGLVLEGDLVCDLSRIITAFPVGDNHAASLINRQRNKQPKQKKNTHTNRLYVLNHRRKFSLGIGCKLQIQRGNTIRPKTKRTW